MLCVCNKWAVKIYVTNAISDSMIIRTAEHSLQVSLDVSPSVLLHLPCEMSHAGWRQCELTYFGAVKSFKGAVRGHAQRGTLNKLRSLLRQLHHSMCQRRI